MNDYLVSVIIPTFNAEKYVKSSVLSALEQTYEKIEVIVVDDGSSDQTVSICKGIAHMDTRLRVIENGHAGVSSARNRGLAEAQGAFVVFFDADDWAEKKLIEYYMNAINNQEVPVAFWMCGMFWDNEAQANVKNECAYLEVERNYIPGKNYILDRSKIAMLEWLRLLNFVTNKIFSLDKIRKYDISFDDTMHIGEDLTFILDYLDCVEGRIGVVNIPLYHYIKRGKSSLSISYYPKGIEHTKTLYRRLIKFQEKQAGTSRDDIAVLKGIYAADWMSRIVAKFEAKEMEPRYFKRYDMAEAEIRSKEFQDLIKDAYRERKMSSVRYRCLRTKHFGVFIFLRRWYQLIKG